MLRERGGRRNAQFEDDIKYGVDCDQDLVDLKFLLKCQCAVTFNTNVLKISLNYIEEKVASVLMAECAVKVDEEMMLRAIKTGQIDFLYSVFAYNKNF